jgi:ABC-type transport system substrate-binding protein
MQVLDESARSQVYFDVQRRIMDEAMIIPIRDYVNLNVTSIRVIGLRYDAQGWFPWLYDVRVD